MNHIEPDRSQGKDDTQMDIASVDTFTGDQGKIDTHYHDVSGVIPAPDQSIPADATGPTSGASTLGTGHPGFANTHPNHACSTTLAGDHEIIDAQTNYVSGVCSSPTDGTASSDEGASGNTLGEAIAATDPKRTPPLLPYLYTPELGLLAQQLDDIEGLRKAQENRLRIFTRTDADKDGEQRGFMLDEDNPVVITCQINLDQLRIIEHKTVLALQKAMRRNPLNEWRQTQLCIGEKTLARLLNTIGDPYVRLDDYTPRTVSQLWAYCGLHTLPDPSRHSDTHEANGSGLIPAGDHMKFDNQGGNVSGTHNVAAKRMKGVKANWSTLAKTRVYLLAESCVKAGVRKDENGERYAKDDSEYAQLYIDRRKHTAVTHPEWTPLHSQNDALRIVSKRILRNLWRAARDIHMNDKEVSVGSE